ncbi:MAG: hypothetical protein KatS3mg076_1778 [Candidatus Binatia bacterium]|nr:MAG: hypothetical protein KatS3mg076_1778 [Candidatus Binatia bacterium]
MSTTSAAASCREVKNLLSLFFDGELDARQMRAIAVHAARCPDCEGELRELERIQELVYQVVAERLEAVDLGNFWEAVETRIGSRRLSRLERLGLWWQDVPAVRRLAGSVVAGVVAASLVLGWFFLAGRSPLPSGTAVANVDASAERAVTVDKIEAATNVALLNEEDAVALWVDDEFLPMSVDVEYLP